MGKATSPNTIRIWGLLVNNSEVHTKQTIITNAEITAIFKDKYRLSMETRLNFFSVGKFQ